MSGPTRKQAAALRHALACGPAREWPVDVSRQVVTACVRAGWLVEGKEGYRLSGPGAVALVAFETDARRRSPRYGRPRIRYGRAMG